MTGLPVTPRHQSQCLWLHPAIGHTRNVTNGSAREVRLQMTRGWYTFPVSSTSYFRVFLIHVPSISSPLSPFNLVKEQEHLKWKIIITHCPSFVHTHTILKFTTIYDIFLWLISIRNPSFNPTTNSDPQSSRRDSFTVHSCVNFVHFPVGTLLNPSLTRSFVLIVYVSTLHPRLSHHSLPVSEGRRLTGLQGVDILTSIRILDWEFGGIPNLPF